MKRAIVACCCLFACSAAAPDPAAPRPEAAAPPLEPRAVELTPLVADLAREPPAAARAPSTSPAPIVPAPLDAVARELRALPSDPAPERTTNDVHYLVSNERRLDLFRPELDELGGVMLGVGSDQSYVMAAWSRTELLVIVDFDQKVVDLHAIHGALMGAAPTVEQYRRLWSKAGAAEARAVLRETLAGSADALALYDEARELVDRRLRKLAQRYIELGIHSFLDTPAQYRYVADLHARGRVVALRGDFTREGLLRSVAAVLEAHQLPLKVLYLSNIEQYFTYREPFKANMLALPFADDTVVLRTLPGRPVGFHYIVQRGDDFHAWMRAPKVWSVYRIRGLGKGEHLVASERFVAGPPPASATTPAPPEGS